MRNRGTFMPCVAVLVVRRAGPERESRGSPPLWPGHFTIEIFPARACCILGRGVGVETLLLGEECVEGNDGR